LYVSSFSRSPLRLAAKDSSCSGAWSDSIISAFLFAFSCVQLPRNSLESPFASPRKARVLSSHRFCHFRNGHFCWVLESAW
jgi:hypothetical protein